MLGNKLLIIYRKLDGARSNLLASKLLIIYRQLFIAYSNVLASKFLIIFRALFAAHLLQYICGDGERGVGGGERARGDDGEAEHLGPESSVKGSHLRLPRS